MQMQEHIDSCVCVRASDVVVRLTFAPNSGLETFSLQGGGSKDGENYPG